MTDLRKAAERLLEALDNGWVQRDDWVAFELRQAIEQTKNQMPTTLCGPNLEQTLNAAGFYRRDSVCCGDYKKCIEPCTPKGEWLAKQELAKPEQAEYDNLSVKFGERAKGYLEGAIKTWQAPAAVTTEQMAKHTLKVIEDAVEQEMNIKDLAEQAGLEVNDNVVSRCELIDLKRFAELVAAAERESCAKLCDERERANLYGVKECAAAIRGRTE